MDVFKLYSIPVQGLKLGITQYEYTLDASFFKLFEDSPVTEGQVRFEVDLDKRPDMLILDFWLEGYVHAECDRCTAQIQLPLEDDRQLIVKYGEAEGEEEDEVVFMSREASDFNLAKYLYEFLVLALPMSNVYDCENDEVPPCNVEILKYLEKNTDDDAPASPWDALKGISNN
jgi:uncharacterized metal-binding protein YceD (DUF177 family)